MQDIISFKERIIRILLGERIMINILLGILGILLAIGYFFSNDHGSHSIFLEKFAPFGAWGTAFAIYGTLKIHGCLYRTSNVLKFVNSVSGLWLWTYLILSSIVLDVSNIRPLEFLLFATVLYELWALVILIYYRVHKPLRRLLDG